MPFDRALGAPFLASFARSGDFEANAPLLGRLPLDLCLGVDFFFLIAMMDRAGVRLLMLSRERPFGLGLGQTDIVVTVYLTQIRGCLQRNAYNSSEQRIQRFDPQHLAGKHCAEVAGDGFGDRV